MLKARIARRKQFSGRSCRNTSNIGSVDVTSILDCCNNWEVHKWMHRESSQLELLHDAPHSILIVSLLKWLYLYTWISRRPTMLYGYCARRSRRWGTGMLLVLVSTVVTHTNDSQKLQCAAYIWKRQFWRLLSSGSQLERGDDAGADRNFNRQGQWLTTMGRSWQLAQVDPHDLHDHRQECNSRTSCGLTVKDIGPNRPK